MLGLELTINNKSKCGFLVGTAGLLGFVVLLLLLQHKSNQHIFAVMGPYILDYYGPVNTLILRVHLVLVSLVKITIEMF